MSHDDLYRPGFGHHKELKKKLSNMPSDVPTWGMLLLEQMALLTEEVLSMKQSTTDLLAAVNALQQNAVKVDQAIDNLASAQADGDETLITGAIQTLKDLKSEQDTHLAKIVAAAPAVIAAPADPVDLNLGTQAAKPAAGTQ